MVVEIIVGITAIGTIAGPAFAILRSNERLRKELEEKDKLRLEERHIFFEKGRNSAIEEMKNIREDRGVGFREAAAIAGQLCAHCRRKCLHCAREEKTRDENRRVAIRVADLDSTDLLDLSMKEVRDMARPEDNDLLAEIEREERQNRRTR